MEDLIKNIFIIQNCWENIFDKNILLRTKKVIIENIDNWRPHENDFVCNMFVSGLPMICLFATFVPFFSFFTLCSCACAMLLCSVVFSPHHQLLSLDIKLH